MFPYVTIIRTYTCCIPKKINKKKNKRTNERTELHQFRKQLSYDGDVSPCQV